MNKQLYINIIARIYEIFFLNVEIVSKAAFACVPVYSM